MFKEYIDILGQCSKDVLKEMASIDIADVKVSKDEKPKKTHSIAHSIHYVDFDDKLEGDFILGFADEAIAIAVASGIAKTAGLTPFKQLDETALDILNEFLNTVVGHTISAWDKKGWNVRFSPPVTLKNLSSNTSDTSQLEAYIIVLKFSENIIIHDNEYDCLDIVLTFTRTINSALLGKRILVVDDSAVMRKIVTKPLEKSGFEVEQAKDGLEAIEKYKTFKPDLTIMDLVMPKLGGLEAIIKIQESDPEAKFIMLTSSSRKDEVITAKTLNVLSYIIKPLKLDDFLVRIKNAFREMNET